MRRSASKGGQAVRRLGGWTLLAASLTVYPPSRLSAQQVNNSGALFLVFPVGARAVGMGQTAAARDGRGGAAFWDPACLAAPEKNESGLHGAKPGAGSTDEAPAYVPSHRLGGRGGALCRRDDRAPD